MLQRCGHASILQKDSSSLQRHTLVSGPSPCQSGGLSGQSWCECLAPPRSECFRWTGGDRHVPWSCSCSSQPWPPGALHGTQTEAPKWGAGLFQAPLPWKWTSGRFAEGDGAGRRQPGSWLHKCLTCTSVAQIQMKRLLSSHVSNPFSIYGQFPFHTSQSHISPDFCWDFAPSCSQDLPGAAHGSNLLGSSTLCPLPGELSASLPTCVPLPFISFLPSLVSPLFWELHALYFFLYSDQSSPSSRIPLLFFPHTINSLTLFQLSVALCH